MSSIIPGHVGGERLACICHRIEVMNNAVFAECPTTNDRTESTPMTIAITNTNTTVVTDGARQAEDILAGD